jgi:siroheme synthase (precorrin-2 oxidase/ferrochelatase)
MVNVNLLADGSEGEGPRTGKMVKKAIFQLFDPSGVNLQHGA